MDKKIWRDTLLKFYKVMVIAILMYECKSWVITAKDWLQLLSAEMNFLWRVKPYETILEIHQQEKTWEQALSKIEYKIAVINRGNI
jgi:hypothetical protein